MATGATYAAVTETRLFGTADMRDRLLGHLRELVQESFEKSFRGGCIYDSALSLVSGGNDAVTVSGTSTGADGQGHVLDVAGGGYATALGFENTAAVEYEVGLHYAEVPNGVQINPRSGMPEFIGFDEQVGESGTPDLVTDNGGTITFRVNSITEAGVSNAGRKVRVWKNIPGPNATTEAVAVEELTVAWTGSNNEITTTAALGQDTVSTTAADYTVALMGPTIKRNTTLYDVDGYAFLGKVTGGGSGSPPSAYDTTDQDVIAMSLSDLADITSRNGATDRLKVDVKSYTGDVGDPQIQVCNPAGTPVFVVDGDGNVTISGTTTQEDFVQVNASETITDNLTAGDDDATDSHKIKGTWWHTNNAETANWLYVDGATGRIGINKLHDATGTWPLDIGSATRINSKLRLSAANVDLEFRETSEPSNAGGLWRFDLNDGDMALRESTAAGGDFSTSSLWWKSDRANAALEFYKHVWPSADNALDLGSSGQEWRDLYVDRIAYVDTLSLSTAAGEGVATSLLPTTDGARDLGAAAYEWKDLYLDGVAYLDTVNLSTAAGEGFTSNVLPATDGTYDLGSASRAWENVYVNNLNVGQDINPAADLTYDLGQAAIRWLNVYTQNVSGGAAPLNLLGEVTFSTTTSEGVGSHIYPATDGVYALGASSRRWDALYLEKLYLSTEANEGCVSNFYPFNNGTLTLGGASSRYWGNVYSYKLTLASTGGNGVASHLHPTSDGGFNLGSSSYRWGEVYTQQVDAYYSNNVVANSGFDIKRHSTTQTTNELTVARLYAQTDATMGDGFGGQVNFYQGVNPVAYLFWTRSFADDQTVLEFRLNNAVDSILPQLTLQYNNLAKLRNLVPYLDEEYYLGSASAKWKEFHISATAGEGVGGTLAPMVDDSYDLGTFSRQWRDLYLDGTASIDIADILILNLSHTAGQGFNVATNFVPTVNNSATVGNSSYRWFGGYFGTVWVGTADTNFALYPNGPDPVVKFDSGEDSFWYDRSANTFYWRVGGSDVASLTAAAFYPSDDSDYFLQMSGLNPIIVFDSGSDDFWYDRASDAFIWRIAGSTVMDITDARLKAYGNVIPDVTVTQDLGGVAANWNWTYTRNVKSDDYLFLSSGDSHTYVEAYEAVPLGTILGDNMTMIGGNGNWTTQIQGGAGRVNLSWNAYYGSEGSPTPTDRWMFWDNGGDGATRCNVSATGAAMYWEWYFDDTAPAAAGDDVTWDTGAAFRIDSGGVTTKAIEAQAGDTWDIGASGAYFANLYANTHYVDANYRVWINGSTPRITWDTADWVDYDRTNDAWRFGIGDSVQVQIGTQDANGYPAVVNIGNAGTAGTTDLRGSHLHLRNGGALSTTINSRLRLASFGWNANTNEDYLTVSAFRHTGGSGWANSSIILSREVDDAADVGGFIEFRQADFRVKGDWGPNVDSTYPLGSLSYRWDGLYTTRLDCVKSDTGAANTAFYLEHDGLTTDDAPLLIARYIANASTGTVADGFGGYIRYETESGQRGRWTWVRDGGTNNYDFFFSCTNGTSTLVERFRMTHDQDIAFGGYVEPPTGVNSGANVQITSGATSDYVWMTSVANGTNRINTTYNAYYDSGTWRYFNAIDAAYREFISASAAFSRQLYWADNSTSAGGAVTWTQILAMNETNITYHTDLLPNATATHNLGGASLYWDLGYIEAIFHSANSWRGEYNWTVGTNTLFKYETSGSRWEWYIASGVASMELSSASLRVRGDVDPDVTNTYDLGASGNEWDHIWCNQLHVDTNVVTFDDYDDLALIDGYGPGPGSEVVTYEKAGEERQIRKADGNLPWPMLGARNVNKQSWFLSIPDSLAFLLGAVKQLHQKHKVEVKTLSDRLTELESKLDRVLAQ